MLSSGFFRWRAAAPMSWPEICERSALHLRNNQMNSVESWGHTLDILRPNNNELLPSWLRLQCFCRYCPVVLYPWQVSLPIRASRRSHFFLCFFTHQKTVEIQPHDFRLAFDLLPRSRLPSTQSILSNSSSKTKVYWCIGNHSTFSTRYTRRFPLPSAYY